MTDASRDTRHERYPRAIHLFRSQLAYQLRVLVRSPMGSFVTLIVPLIVLLAVNLLYEGHRIAGRGGIRYAQFFTPAMVAFAVVNACYTSVVSQTTLARDEGILKRIRSTPLPPWIYMAGRLGSASIVAALGALVIVAVSTWIYGFQIMWSSIPAVLVTLALAMFCFCALGLAVTVLIPNADSAFSVAWGTILPLCFISDIFIPTEGAPGWLRALASVFPLKAFADDLEWAFNPVQDASALQFGHLELLAAWGIAASAFALLAFRWEPRSGRGGGGRMSFSIDRARTLLVPHRDSAS